MPYNFPHYEWKKTVQDYLDGKPLIEVNSVQGFHDVTDLLLPGRHSLLLIDKNGFPLTGREVTSLRSNHSEGVRFPLDLYIAHEASLQGELPKQIRIDCAGLGGHELVGGHIPWHICLRADPHGQGTCGPSVAAIETMYHDGNRRPSHTVALGLTKAMNEFLVLHYFATDSASSWDSFLAEHLPEGLWPRADARGHTALAMFEKSHVAPSYRRLPHVTWTDSVSLLLDLLLGAGKLRYLSTRPPPKKHREVFVRGFSAGLYSGLCRLHML